MSLASDARSAAARQRPISRLAKVVGQAGGRVDNRHTATARYFDPIKTANLFGRIARSYVGPREQKIKD